MSFKEEDWKNGYYSDRATQVNFISEQPRETVKVGGKFTFSTNGSPETGDILFSEVY